MVVGAAAGATRGTIPFLSWGWQGAGGLVPYAVPASGALHSRASEMTGISTSPVAETALEYSG